MKITINITKKEIDHLKTCDGCELDACSTIDCIIKKIRKKIGGRKNENL